MYLRIDFWMIIMTINYVIICVIIYYVIIYISIDLVAASFYGQPKIHETGFSICLSVSYSGSPLYSHNKYIANTLKAYIKDKNSNAKNFATFSNFIRNVPIKDDKIMVSFWRQILVQEHSCNWYVKHNQVLC